MYLQSTVVPFVIFDIENGLAWVHSFEGTGFVITQTGHVMTARHVIELGMQKAQSQGRVLGIVGKGENGRSPQSLIAPILGFDFAPSPFDVAICRTPYEAETGFRFGAFPGEVLWKDVAAYGYPAAALAQPMKADGTRDMRINLRANKGYIQRHLKPGDMPIGENPDGFELSFLIGPGMSGSPVFVYQGATDLIVGVAVSSFRSEILDYEMLEVNDDGSKYSERKVKIEEYGFAHSVEGLLGWRPQILGAPLADCLLAK